MPSSMNIQEAAAGIHCPVSPLIAKRFESTQKPASCPRCGSSRVANFLYGYPAFSERLEQDLGAGRITLGDCCVSDDDPVWRCTACKADIYKTH